MKTIDGFHLWNDKDEATRLVETYHYSHNLPSSSHPCFVLCEDGGLFGDRGEAIAACCFGQPVGWNGKGMLELNRLVLHPDYRSKVKLTSLIAIAAKTLKAEGVPLLISYADPNQGHHGGIYQAASWNFHGHQLRGDAPQMNALDIEGLGIVHSRTANSRWGTSSIPRLERMLNTKIKPVYFESKWLFWRALTKEGKKMAVDCGLTHRPYKKPDHGETDVP